MGQITAKVPKHLVIIPDGNRRWAKSKGLESVSGHEKATQTDNIIRLLDEAQELGIKYLSVWAFSTENWKRSKVEINFLFKLIIKMAGDLEGYAKERKIKLRHIGRKDRLPKRVIETLEKFEQETKDNNGLNFSVLLDYGGRDDIIRAVNKILVNGEKEIG